LRLVIIALIVFIVFKTSTFGWHIFSKSFLKPTKENSEFAKTLESHVRKLADEIGDRSVFKYEKLDEAARYITQTLRSFGYNVEFQSYNVWDKTVRNIIASKEGVQKPEEIIIVGAHYDTCFNPGADDNASSVAGLLELAKFFYHRQTNCSIKFVAFVNEEPPFFKTADMGSVFFVREAKAKGENIKATLILEMIGYYKDNPNSQRYPPFFGFFYPNKGNFIAVVGNPHSRRLLRQVTSTFRNHSRFPLESVLSFGFIPGADFSDHWSFWKEKYPALMITDTAFYRNPHYHISSDTYEKLNYESMAEVVKGLMEVLTELTK